MQLPHVEEDMLKHFYSKRRNIKSLAQLAKMSDEDRRLLLRGLAEEQYKDLVKVILKLLAQICILLHILTIPQCAGFGKLPKPIYVGDNGSG